MSLKDNFSSSRMGLGACAATILVLLTACNNVPSVGEGPTLEPVPSTTAPEAPAPSTADPAPDKAVPPTAAPEAPAPSTADPAPDKAVPPTAAPEAPAPSTADPSVVKEGFSPIQMDLKTDPSNTRLNDFAPGMTACENVMKKILIRDDKFGSSVHISKVSAENLGPGAGGLATLPPKRDYERHSKSGDGWIKFSSDQPNQYIVCRVFAHEFLHTMTIDHMGEGIMNSQPFIDPAIANELAQIGYEFIEPVQSELDSGNRVSIDKLIADFGGTTAEALKAQRIAK